MIKEINIPSGWREIKLGEVFLFLRTSSYSRCQTSKASKNALYIHYGDIHKINNLTLDFKQENILRLNDDIDSSSLDFLQNGDLIVADASEDYLGIGSCSEIKNLNERAVSGLHTFALRPNINFIKTGFSSLLLNSFFVKNYLKKIATGASVLGISKYYLARTPLILPPLQEQKAIADILEKWDEAIEKTSKLIDAKRKKFEWLLNNLIKKQQGYEYESLKLVDCCKKITTGKLDANAMVKNGKYRFYTCAKEHYFIDDYKFDGEALLVSGNGANVGYIHYYKGKFNAYQRTYVLMNFYKNIHYIKYCLDKNLSKRINAQVNGGNTPYIKLETISEMMIEIPNSKILQENIVNTLNTAKKEITILEEILAKYKNQKKGLMQNLLTGKLRINKKECK
jgi:type I restriction enzyme S subunit